MLQCALIHGTSQPFKKFSNKYVTCNLKTTSVNDWKAECKKSNEEGASEFKFSRKGRQNFLDDELLGKVKSIVIGIRIAGTLISTQQVINVANGVVKVAHPY